jgi:glycerol-3-phosphate acyltransferase PlsY
MPEGITSFNHYIPDFINIKTFFSGCKTLMDIWSIFIALLIGAYLLGSIPFGLMVGRRVRGVDITEVGSGNIGAANVAREVGLAWGVVTLLADAFKGFIPVAFVPCLFGASGEIDEALRGLVGLAALLGNQFPVYHHRKGGKGVATCLGVFLAISPVSCVFSGVLFIIVVAMRRYVSLGSMTAALSMPVWLSIGGYSNFLIITSIAMSLLIVLRHRDNIWRLAKGNERRWHIKGNHNSRSIRRSSSPSE